MKWMPLGACLARAKRSQRADKLMGNSWDDVDSCSRTTFVLKIIVERTCFPCPVASGSDKWPKALSHIAGYYQTYITFTLFVKEVERVFHLLSSLTYPSCCSLWPLPSSQGNFLLNSWQKLSTLLHFNNNKSFILRLGAQKRLKYYFLHWSLGSAVGSASVS